MTPTRSAATSTPINSVLAERWSPRAFDQEAPLDEVKLTAALEAARWSPSANNSQPWSFIVARRGTPEFEAIVDHLVGFNAAWAGSAQVLIVNLAEVREADGTPRRWAEYDLGQAVAHLSVQAHHDGLHAHQLGGFDAAGLHAAFFLPERLTPVSITALGVLGSPDLLAEPARVRELAPRTRRPLDDLLLVNQ